MEIFAYGNNGSLTGIFNAIAAIMGGADYLDLVRAIALIGLLVALFSGLFSPGRTQFIGWTWFMGFTLVYLIAFVPKTTVVVVDKLGSQPPVAIGNVPLGVAVFGHITSTVGDVLTRLFETAFQVIPDPGANLPPELTYQRNGVLFGNRLIQQSRKLNVSDPQLRTDMISFINNCTLYDLSDGAAAGGVDPRDFAQSLDVWPLMATTSPGRFSTYGNPATVDTCVNVYNVLNASLPAAIDEQRKRLALIMNPAVGTLAAVGAIDGQVQASYRKLLGDAASGVTQLLRQNILVNLVQDTSLIKGQQISDPASVMLATSRAQATASVNSSYATMGSLAAEALPMFRNVIEGVIYAIFPFVLLLMMMSHGRGLGLIIKSFIFGLIWIQLWPPLYAILNYVATLASSQNLTAAASLPTGIQGLALDTASSIYNGAISAQAVAGYLVISIPIIATAIIKGGEVAFQAVSGVAGLQSAAQAEGALAGRGIVNQGQATVDKFSLDAQYTQPSQVSSVDAYGNTNVRLLGTGVEAVKLLENSAYFGAQLASAKVTSLQQGASQASERAHTEAAAATAETVSTLGQTVAKSGDSLSTQELGNGVTASEGSGLQNTHATLKSEQARLQRDYQISDQDAGTVAIAAQAGLGFDAGKIANLKGGGTLDQSYQSRLQRAYDEARQNVSQEQVQATRDYASRVATDESFRSALLTRQGDAEGINAGFTSARRHVEEARASYAQRDALSEEARVVESKSANTNYDWARDPANSADVSSIAGRLGGTADPVAKQAIIDNYFAEKATLSRPTRYLSGDSVRWSNGEVEQIYRDDKQSSSVNPDLRADFDRNRLAIGGVNTGPLGDGGLRGRAAADRESARNEVAAGRGRLAREQVTSQQRFDSQSGLGGQDRDGKFGSNQSTGTRAFNSAVEDGKRSAENFVDGVKDATFGTVDRALDKVDRLLNGPRK